MKVDIQKLKQKMDGKKMSNEAFAKALEINPATLYRKLTSNGESFTVGQMHKAADVLSLTREEATDIFLA